MNFVLPKPWFGGVDFTLLVIAFRARRRRKNLAVA